MDYEVAADRENKALRFFYATELYLYGRNYKDAEMLEQSMKLMADIIKKKAGGPDSLATLCINMAMQYLYGDKNFLDRRNVDPKLMGMAETYARIALSFSDKYAESCVLLGDIYMAKEKPDDAQKLYRQAMKKKFDGLGVQNMIFYEEVPARRLMEIHAKKKDLELALHFSRQVLNHSGPDHGIYELRKQLIEELLQEDSKILKFKSAKEK
jgi:TPR repeat protein